MRKIGTAALSAALLCGAGAGALAQDDQASFAVDDTIVVRGVNIPDEKRATSEISAVLDEASFDRTGDSNIADALRRVTGLSLADGKFVIVRGLNERYSSATLNGSPLPSPEPLRRVAPLDLFPTSVLGGSLVQKTFSPEFSGEFGGGAIDLRTKSLPEEAFFEIEGSIGLDTESTFHKGLTYDGGNRDWLGFDDGTRDVPAGLVSIFENGPALTPGLLSQEEQDALDVTVENERTLLLFEDDTPPNWSARMTGGQRFDVNNALSLGYVATVGLGNDFVTREGRRRRNTGVDTATGEFDSNQGLSFNYRSTQQNVSLNGLLSAGAEIYDNHEVTATAILLRSTTKEARIETGLNNDRNALRQDSTEFFERQVWQFQGNGEHLFPDSGDLSLNWRIAYGEAFRDSPYERTTRYEIDEDTGALTYDFTGQVTDRSPVNFSRLDDENFGGGVDLVLPIMLGDNPVDLKAGYAYTDKMRATFDRRFAYVSSVVIPELAGSRADLIFSDPVVGTSLLDFEQSGVSPGNPDNFEGALEVHAAYAGLDAELSPYIRLAAGFRFEDGEQTTRAFRTGFEDTATDFDPIDESYFLPAFTATWNPAGNIQLRVAYSKTITRPQFREIAPITFTNPDTDIPSFGNPLLVNSELDNIDARLEWYFGRGEFLTFGGFYKDIQNPIEEITSTGFSGGDQGGSSFVNSPSAELYGFEFEFQKNFPVDRWFESGWLGQWASTKELVLITNYTFTKSDVTGGPALVNRFRANGQLDTPDQVTVTGDRSLQGQSDHLANVQIGYEDFERQSRATFLFNYASSRIQQIEGGAPNNRVVERPPILLDFVWSRDLEFLGGAHNLEFGVRNILGEDYDARQETSTDSIVYDEYSIGRTFSLTLKRMF